jgi:hypothetical protein
VVRLSDSQCRSHNSPGFDPSILRHNGTGGEADEAVLNIVQKKKKFTAKKRSALLHSVKCVQADVYRTVEKKVIFIYKCNNQEHVPKNCCLYSNGNDNGRKKILN